MKDETIPRHMTATDQHPAPEKLIAYQKDELSADEDDAVREHLVDCADCTGLVLELTTPRETDAIAEELSEIDLQRAWRRARPRLEPQAQLTTARRAWLPPSRLVALAAGLLLAIVIPWRSLFFDSDTRSLVRLVPLSASRSPGGAEPCKSLTGGSGDRQLLLPVHDAPADSDFRLEILTGERQLLTTHTLATPSADGFIFELHALKAGRYYLYLVDTQPHEPLLVERYCIQILDG